MKLVIDTNIIISAIIKSGLTRNIIINKNIALLTPDYTIEEIEKHQKYICNKIRTSEDDVEVLISFIFKYRDYSFRRI